ncbi:M23 family metallopeptidase [Devosia sp.]|uniref:M23 family metallopeptidase n=1 Tax=Devosia sp. TaxID=1871048 RepID=UPI003A8E4D5E
MRAKSEARRPQVKVFSRPKPAPKTASGPGIRPALFYSVFALLFGSNVLTAVALMMAPDIAALAGDKTAMVTAAYEDRIAQLRVEVDRLHSRQYAQAGDINLQLQEVSQQQEVLSEQHQLVRQLAAKAAEMGLQTADLKMTAPVPPIPAVRSGTDELADVSAKMHTMMDESRLALAAISQSATQSTLAILGALDDIGIKPALPDDATAMGGPLLPEATTARPISLADEATEAFQALARFRAARGALDFAPIHGPMADMSRVSSNFGNRRDPFTGKRAFHGGIDFPAARGTPVLSAGEGKVTFVGRKSGYGNVVEVTHDTGLITRYGHLSAFIAKQGQKVSAGTPIARVGSTGRSTGPHLHFEVRRKNVPLDPTRFLAVGRKLQQYLGA